MKLYLVYYNDDLGNLTDVGIVRAQSTAEVARRVDLPYEDQTRHIRLLTEKDREMLEEMMGDETYREGMQTVEDEGEFYYAP